MRNLFKQRSSVKFWVLIEKSSPETRRVLQQAYKEDCKSRKQCFEWLKHFKSGRLSIVSRV